MINTRTGVRHPLRPGHARGRPAQERFFGGGCRGEGRGEASGDQRYSPEATSPSSHAFYLCLSLLRLANVVSQEVFIVNLPRARTRAPRRRLRGFSRGRAG